MIQIDGLSERQQAICDLLWGMNTIESVTAFIESLPEEEQYECWLMVEMMKLAVIDEYADTDTDVAKVEIKKIMYGY